MRYFIAPLLGGLLGYGFREMVAKPENVYSPAYCFMTLFLAGVGLHYVVIAIAEFLDSLDN